MTLQPALKENDECPGKSKFREFFIVMVFQLVSKDNLKVLAVIQQFISRLTAVQPVIVVQMVHAVEDPNLVVTQNQLYPSRNRVNQE